MYKVRCRTFSLNLNCTETDPDHLPYSVRTDCCEAVTLNRYTSATECCLSLIKAGLSPPIGDHNTPVNDNTRNNSLHAYITGIAIFAILAGIFVSGIRSIRRRQNQARQARQRRNNAGTERADMSTVQQPPVIIDTHQSQYTMDLPSYEQLEADGFTKDYKMKHIHGDETPPPPYPGITEHTSYSQRTNNDDNTATTLAANT